jgi:hypothetical protein
MTRTVQESRSYTGTPEQGYQPVEGKMDWIIRVVAAPAAKPAAQ